MNISTLNHYRSRQPQPEYRDQKPNHQSVDTLPAVPATSEAPETSRQESSQGEFLANAFDALMANRIGLNKSEIDKLKEEIEKLEKAIDALESQQKQALEKMQRKLAVLENRLEQLLRQAAERHAEKENQQAPELE
ncbi:hypothetical protein HMF8227_00128 [Saliniradius amylolyticus]|uniref:Uncharacterized protein n=1 Tax=Saliniradius amylolyticus TaxID=2183582 RepID=A0A2S2DZ34_9ALTE|nr:hypothetical protein [Saliniradius amylolyticus]AWL10636.1 hypothetical protein HMF8227_00128 [Saliniradius amylolyticus]